MNFYIIFQLGRWLMPEIDISSYGKSRVFAPQAQLEESANDRSKPEEPISRVLMRTPGSGILPVLDDFPSTGSIVSGRDEVPGQP